jgi:hypothetical protein
MNLTTHLYLVPRSRMTPYMLLGVDGNSCAGFFLVKKIYRAGDCIRVRRICRSQSLSFISEDKKLCSCRNVVFYCKTYLMSNVLLTYLLTPWSRVLLEKLTGLQLVKKFPTFYGVLRFITAFTSALHLSLSWASSIQSIPPPPTSWRSILILSSHLRLGRYLFLNKIKFTYYLLVGCTCSLIDISVSKKISVSTFRAGVHKPRTPGRRRD